GREGVRTVFPEATAEFCLGRSSAGAAQHWWGESVRMQRPSVVSILAMAVRTEAAVGLCRLRPVPLAVVARVARVAGWWMCASGVGDFWRICGSVASRPSATASILLVQVGSRSSCFSAVVLIRRPHCLSTGSCQYPSAFACPSRTGRCVESIGGAD
ncbi:hypothetical protein BC831DRAFT_467334, partial [Entophlyctis helioformis]